MTRSPWVLAALAVVAVLAFCGEARAQGSDASKAEAYYVQALQLFNEGRYQDSLEHFNRAIDLNANPIYYCNRAAVELKLKESRAALDSLRLCRDHFDSGDRSEMVEIDAEIKALEVFVDGVDHTSRSVAASIAGGLYGDDGPGGSGDNDGLLLLGAWTTAGVAALSLSAALVLDLMTQPVIEDFEKEAESGRDRSRYDELRSTINSRKLIISSLATVGAVTLVTSGALFWLHSEEEVAPSPVNAGFSLVQGGAIVKWGASF
jgi:tetratricopeptide (TPR) repeat protein